MILPNTAVTAANRKEMGAFKIILQNNPRVNVSPTW